MAKIQDIRSRTKRSNGTRNIFRIKHIVRHHSATTNGNFDSFWRHWNGVKGWGTGGYHEIILRDGTVQICYDPHEITNGVANMNKNCYHICVVGNGSFTAAQEKAWDERVKYNMERLNIGVSNVKGHGELTPTSCPGINMDMVRARVQGTKTQAAPKQQVKSVTTSNTYTVQKGDTLWAIATSNNMSVEQLKDLNKLKSDVIHPGDKLKVTGSASQSKKSGKPKANLVVDGRWGKATTRALQKYFGTHADGEIWGQVRNAVTSKITGGIVYGGGGSPVIRELQRLVGAKVDGILGKETISKLQRYLGTSVDGELWSPSTAVKEVQRRLNAGTF